MDTTPRIRGAVRAALFAIVLIWPFAGTAQGRVPPPPPDDLPSVKLAVAPAIHKYGPSFDSAPVLMTVGIPLAKLWKVPEVDGRPALQLTGPERWQFRTLERWPDGSVRWALGRAVVTAGNGAPTTAVSLTAGLGLSAGVNLASKGQGLVLVDTGPLQAVIRTNPFNLLDWVFVDGLEIVKSGTSPGIVAKLPDGTPLSPGKDTLVTIPENGPAYALVRVDGTLEDPSGHGVADFTCRLGFVHGSRDVQVDFTLRNANIERPAHLSLKSIELVLRTSPGTGPVARAALPAAGETSTALAPGATLWAYQAYSSAYTEQVKGTGTAWLSPIPKLDANTFSQEGYQVGLDTQLLASYDKDGYPNPAWVDLNGSAGGCTVSIRQMPYFWPVALEADGAGRVSAGIFTPRNGTGYTWSWRSHESRTALFSFHKGPAAAPVQAARRLESPVIGRYADYGLYDLARVFPYDLVTVANQNALYALLGLHYSMTVSNLYLTVTRFLPTSSGGGENNHDYAQRLLLGEFLRFGTGGQWHVAMDLALYKSEIQIPRSDNFDHAQDPGPTNPEVPHTTNVFGDDEHRYRGGIALAYWLTGDERFREALFDEAEVLPWVSIWPHERSMYQSLVALADVADFTGKHAELDPFIHARLKYFDPPILDVDTTPVGYGWDSTPGNGNRGYYAYSEQGNSEKPPGENYITRGFITASMGPRALYRAARALPDGDPDAAIARARIVDLAKYTREELYPYFSDPTLRHLVYSYNVTLKTVNLYETTDYHPILIGMAEAWRQTGDVSYLLKGIEQMEGFYVHGKMGYMDRRIECQHFCQALIDALAQYGYPFP